MKRILPFLVGALLPGLTWAQSTPGQVMTYQGPSLGRQWVLPSANTSAGVTGTGSAVFGTGPTITSPIIAGHPRTSGTAPAATVCGTTPAVLGTDAAGQVTMGTGTPTGCVLTFATAFTAAPFCTVSWNANLAAMGYSVSTTALTLTQTATDSTIVRWTCTARSGG